MIYSKQNKAAKRAALFCFEVMRQNRTSWISFLNLAASAIL